MRVLEVISSHISGGAAAPALLLSKELVRRGHEVLFSCVRGSGPAGMAASAFAARHEELYRGALVARGLASARRPPGSADEWRSRRDGLLGCLREAVERSPEGTITSRLGSVKRSA